MRFNTRRAAKRSLDQQICLFLVLPAIVLVVLSFLPIGKSFVGITYASDTGNIGGFLNSVTDGSNQLGSILPGLGVTASEVGAANQSVQTPSSSNYIPQTSGDLQLSDTNSTSQASSTNSSSTSSSSGDNLVNLVLPSSIPNTFGNDSSSSTVDSFISYFVTFFLGILALAAFLGIIYSGYMMITAGGDAARVATARKNIVWAIVGIVVALSAYLIIELVTNFAGSL